jgi:heptosyltransferase-2
MKILLIPKGFFGDIILVTPILASLRSCGHSVTVVVPPAAKGILGSDLADDIVVFDRRKEFRGLSGLRAFARRLKAMHFDRAYSFQRSARTSLLFRLAGIPERVGYDDAHLGFLYTKRVPRTESVHEVLRSFELVVDELEPEPQREVNKLLKSERTFDSEFGRLQVSIPPREELSEMVLEVITGELPFIVLAPGSVWATKRWNAEGYRDVAKAYIHEKHRVVLVGAPNESAVCDEVAADLPVVNLCGKTTLPELIAIIAEAAGVVCNDSMALHVSSATQTPCVAVFCATSPTFGFGPWKNKAIVLEKSELFCKPCRRHGSHSCPTGTRACMLGVSGDEVFMALNSLMQRHAPFSDDDSREVKRVQ